ncbi:TIGR03085 family metal-binding protein [Gordonia sinesedis]
MTTVAQAERAALVESLRAAGPEAPTLCEGWTAHDLAAHLVVREHRPDTLPGIVLSPLAGYTEHVQDRVAARESWEHLVDQVADGPPIISPFWLVDRWANVGEMFVHHEDVLRGGADPDGAWTPRPLSSELERALETVGRMIGRTTLRHAPAEVTLTLPDGRALLTRGDGEPVTVTGTVGELVLWAYGRAPVNVTLDGDTAAVAALRDAKRGI